MSRKRIIARKIAGKLVDFICFFFLSCFITTCSIMMFAHGADFTVEYITARARQTFVNLFFISVFFVIVDSLRRRLTLEKSIENITLALNQITKGDFSVRIEKTGRNYTWYDFEKIIDGINTMTEELSSVEIFKNDFISNVSHEIKTPLAVIQNYGTLLQSPNLSEESRMEYAKAITQASRRLSEMISNILKLSKLENQQIFPKTENYDLSEQLCECLLNFESLWEEKSISIESEIEDSVTINADPEMMSLVWNNLFSNAMKFTPENGEVFVALKKDGNSAVVTVRDTGCGMTEEVKNHIFDKFYQGDPSRASAGNGLGLSLVKKIIDITKSEIAVSSEPGKGSEFTVTVKSN